ncbi:MAG: DUF4136 domain-containing protein [Xanthomonadales bacterium]|nr:DUF4136 domain-containing protein [Xanthomonadales bacterium]
MNTMSFNFCRAAYVGLVASLLSASVQAYDVNVDYDNTVNFNNFHTFQLTPNPTGMLAQQDPIMDQKVQGMIIQAFIGQGLAQVTENPDLQITYDASTKQNVVLNTMGPGIGFGVGWGRFGGMGMATTTESTFTEGTLVIDAAAVATKKIVWRGIAEESVSSDPQRTESNIQGAIKELFEKWDRIKKQNAN